MRAKTEWLKSFGICITALALSGVASAQEFDTNEKQLAEVYSGDYTGKLTLPTRSAISPAGRFGATATFTRRCLWTRAASATVSVCVKLTDLREAMKSPRLPARASGYRARSTGWWSPTTPTGLGSSPTFSQDHRW